MEHPQAPVVVLYLTWLEGGGILFGGATGNRLGSSGSGRGFNGDQCRCWFVVVTKVPRSRVLGCGDS